MQFKYFSRSISLFVFLFGSISSSDQVPILIDAGFGWGEYEIFGANEFGQNLPGTSLRDTSLRLYGTQIKLAGRVEQEVIKKYQDKIPEQYRKQVTSLQSVSITPMWIPKTLFITSGQNDIHAYGASWGFTPGLSQNIFGIRLAASAGLVLNLAQIRHSQLDQSKFFARPGLRGEFQISIPIFYFTRLTVGTFGDYFISQKLFSNTSSNSMRSQFAMIEFSIPYEVSFN